MVGCVLVDAAQSGAYSLSICPFYNDAAPTSICGRSLPIQTAKKGTCALLTALPTNGLDSVGGRFTI